MRTLRPTLLVLAALSAPLLLGSRCQEEVDCAPDCDLECAAGYKHDLGGNAYCECLPDLACIQVLASALNPATGACVVFPTPCHVPTGWSPCPAGCDINGVWVPEGESAPAGDGCNTCSCLASGRVACTRIACAACQHDGKVHPVGETFPAGDGCNACTCLSAGRVACTKKACPECFGERALCTRTGGRWDTRSCGHYRCGNPPLCEAIIPGCDCGPGRSFVEGAGCMDDARCGPAACDFDSDCPEGSFCEGSSVCPPDVTCVWEGEPGVCRPLP